MSVVMTTRSDTRFKAAGSCHLNTLRVIEILQYISDDVRAADLDRPGGSEFWTPLQIACRANRVAVANLLLDRLHCPLDNAVAS